MPQPLFVADAFTSRTCRGNPAGVCPLESWLADDVMQRIAAEVALSETAFFVRRADGEFDLRWFTPAAEVDLCGHATLASAFVLLRLLEPQRASVGFHTRSGRLFVERRGERFAMELPRRVPRPIDPPRELESAVGARVLEWLRGQYTLAVLESADAVRALRPDLARIRELNVTARGEDCDFVSRFFAPQWGIPEDPVTGSAHSSLVPYWSQRLGRRRLVARQVSARGGELECEDREASVALIGACTLFSRGEIVMDDL